MENETFDNFYPVYSRNMRDLGTPPYPRLFLKRIIEYFPNNTDVLTVRLKDRVIAGMFIFKHEKVFYEPYASSLREYNKYCPNNLLYWHAIKKACLEGYEIFDMGRSTKDSGTYKFKKQWGAEAITLSYQYYFNKENKMPAMDAHKNKYALFINVWKKFPIWFTNLAGPRLIRFLPEL